MPDALSKSTWSTLLSTDLLDLKKKLASSKPRPPGSSPAKMHTSPQRLPGALCDGRCCSGTASASASPGAPHHRALHGLGQNCQLAISTNFEWRPWRIKCNPGTHSADRRIYDLGSCWSSGSGQSARPPALAAWKTWGTMLPNFLPVLGTAFFQNNTTQMEAQDCWF